jgi:hypothetical protein
MYVGNASWRVAISRFQRAIQAAFTNQLEFGANVGGSFRAGKSMSIKSFLLTLAIFCGGYVSNTLLDNAVDAAEKYFHLSTTAYKSDSNGYIICSNEKPKDSPVGPIVAAPANF